MEAEAWSSCEPAFPHPSLCSDSCKVEVTHVNIYLITTCELCRAVSSLWGRHDLHYNDTVDIFPVTLIVTSLLPVGICGLIRQLVQAIWSCDETRQEWGGWDLREKDEGGKDDSWDIKTHRIFINVSSSNLLPHAPVFLSVDSQAPRAAEPSILTAHCLLLAFMVLVAVTLSEGGALAFWAAKPTREGCLGALVLFFKPLGSKADSDTLRLSWGQCYSTLSGFCIWLSWWSSPLVKFVGSSAEIL